MLLLGFKWPAVQPYYSQKSDIHTTDMAPAADQSKLSIARSCPGPQDFLFAFLFKPFFENSTSWSYTFPFLSSYLSRFVIFHHFQFSKEKMSLIFSAWRLQSSPWTSVIRLGKGSTEVSGVEVQERLLCLNLCGKKHVWGVESSFSESLTFLVTSFFLSLSSTNPPSCSESFIAVLLGKLRKQIP